jgi:DNA-binding Lrp family transcriptional regulator
MVLEDFHPLDRRLLDEWQRDLPLVPRPYRAIARAMGMGEAEVIERLKRLIQAGAVARIGGIARPNCAGASTLAAIAAPEDRIEEVAAIIGAEPGVNHSYQREDAFNLWFVATGPDREAVTATLGRIHEKSGLEVLDLRLLRPYHIDLGFSLNGGRRHSSARAEADESALREGDRDLIQAMTEGLPLAPAPFAVLAERLGGGEARLLERSAALLAAGILTRIGVIVRHRALGWKANAMVVWDLPEAEIDAAGERLAARPGVNLCYRRQSYPGLWPYGLYCMIHGRNREETLGLLEEAEAAAGLAGKPRRILFSLRCFKQCGALLGNGKEAA